MLIEFSEESLEKILAFQESEGFNTVQEAITVAVTACLPSDVHAKLWEEGKISNPDPLYSRGKMDFSEALHKLKEGARVTRMGWNGKGQYIELAEYVMYRKKVGYPPVFIKDKPVIVFHGTSGIQVGWLASQGDMMAKDWVTIPE